MKLPLLGFVCLLYEMGIAVPRLPLLIVVRAKMSKRACVEG